MKKLLAYAAALLLILESTAYAQGGGSGAVGGAAGGTGAGMGATSDGSVDGSKSSTGPKAAQSDTSLPPAPNSITAGNRTRSYGNNSPLPGQPGNPQTGPIRR